MSFQNHEPCTRCGSKNNLARYADGGGWCFGCGLWQPPTQAPSSFLSRASHDLPQELPEYPRIPEDSGTQFSEEAVRWLAKFHLSIPDAIRHGVVYSPSMQQLIYQMGSVWQARNFNPERLKKSKNFTSGNVNECRHIYGHIDDRGDDSSVQLSPQTLVIVEDPVSAMRIAPLRPSMPLLGSHLATSRLIALTGLYDSIWFWLDSDKLKEARAMAERARLIDIHVKVIYTDLDPKCYTHTELMEILK